MEQLLWKIIKVDLKKETLTVIPQLKIYYLFDLFLKRLR